MGSRTMLSNIEAAPVSFNIIESYQEQHATSEYFDDFSRSVGKPVVIRPEQGTIKLPIDPMSSVLASMGESQMSGPKSARATMPCMRTQKKTRKNDSLGMRFSQAAAVQIANNPLPTSYRRSNAAVSCSSNF